jgi:two-component system sensor histidine kinase HydH
MKISYKTASWIALALGWLLLSALAFFVLLGWRDRARLIRDRDNEQLLNALFASLRAYDDFGSAIEENQLLQERIAGFGVYGADLEPVYRWGSAPEHFNEGMLEKYAVSRAGRYTIPDARGRAVKFVIQMERMMPNPPPRRPANRDTAPEYMAGPEPDPYRAPPNRPGDTSRPGDASRRMPPGFLGVLAQGKYSYVDVVHAAYWQTITLTAILFPFSSLVVLALLLYIRGLYVRNREYRKRIEEQKHLVVLGSAASTLAHEIKNPLLAIRIQTGILEKIYAGEGRDEIRIINEEVDRLSALTYRIGDYIRDPRGNPEVVMVYDVLEETAERLLGGGAASGSFITAASSRSARVCADRERLRSVFENLIRNALESGGRPEEAGAEITVNGNSVTITLFDRGRGVAAADMERVFDPFFTRKSTGTGIGLSICRRFAEAAGGTMRMENREGGGAAAHLVLPAIAGGAIAGDPGPAGTGE